MLLAVLALAVVLRRTPLARVEELRALRRGAGAMLLLGIATRALRWSSASS